MDEPRRQAPILSTSSVQEEGQPTEANEQNEPHEPPRRPQGSFLEVLGVFTILGLTSFGGPIAHLGYFRQEIV
ncbi:MAG: hypothetical protein E6I80_30145, partial [Chloroflexi bacterium]